MRPVTPLVLALTSASLAAAQSPAPANANDPIAQAWPELLPAAFAPPQPAPPTPLSLDWPDAYIEGLNVLDLGPLSSEAIAAADARAAERYRGVNPGPARIGVVRPLADHAVVLPGGGALVRDAATGEFAWTFAIASPGALELRVHFTEFDVGRCRLVMYAYENGAPVVHGPYTGLGRERDGAFWSTTLPGDRVYFEITGPDQPALRIDELVHVDRDFDLPQMETGDCSGVCPCHLDVMCQGDPPANFYARQATGRMGYVSDGESYVCTGTMISDLDLDTYVPYFLTAAHCLSTQAEVNSLEVTWFYQSNNSPGNCSGSPSVPARSSLPKTNGGTLLHETGPPALTNDSCLIRLNPDQIPAGVGFAGWTPDQEAGVIGIHHPAGSWKRAAFGHFESLSIDCGADCGCFDSAYYAFYDLDRGIIQGGSSGSGMFNGAGQLIGQLFGHCTLCPDAEDCDHAGDWCLMYGEWENTWPDVQYWMELGGTIWVDHANTSSPWDGSWTHPYRRVVDGYNAAWNDTRLVVRAGSYSEALTMNKRIRVISSGGTAFIGR
ncbi:MAG: hypothetical protein AB7Q17_12705 [Phycisphaerae bacterium]